VVARVRAVAARVRAAAARAREAEKVGERAEVAAVTSTSHGTLRSYVCSGIRVLFRRRGSFAGTRDAEVSRSSSSAESIGIKKKPGEARRVLLQQSPSSPRRR
jgi:hypothetical protein